MSREPKTICIVLFFLCKEKKKNCISLSTKTIFFYPQAFKPLWNKKKKVLIVELILSQGDFLSLGDFLGERLNETNQHFQQWMSWLPQR
jgi:hypothetical protein